MSRHPFCFAVLLLLVWMCGSSGAAHSQAAGARVMHSLANHNLGLLPTRQSDLQAPAGGRVFRNPHLVDVNGVLMAIAGALFDGPAGNGKASMKLAAQISKDNGWTWSQYLGQDAYGAPAGYPQPSSTSLLPGGMNSFFAFVEGYDMRNGLTIRYDERDTNGLESKIHFLLTVPGRGRDAGMRSVSMRFPIPYPRSNADVLGFINNASTPITKMRDNTFVFPVQFLTKGGSTASTVLYLKPGAKQWMFAKSASHAGCTSPSILEWEDGKLLMITSCADGSRRVYESGDNGDTWTEALGTLSRVWHNSLGNAGPYTQGGFISATIDGKKVILLTQLEKPRHGPTSELHLWLTDTNRIYHVGLISTGENAASSSLFYRDNKLYCLYEAGEGSNYRVLLLDLATGMHRIRNALSTWTEQDRVFSGSCISPAAGTALTRGHCSVSIPTAGLVGHLSDKLRGTQWEDDYLGVEATVKGAPRKALNGLTFQGRGTGAEWPVDIQWTNRPHHFATYNFTLAATVSIHEVPTGTAPLMGLKKAGRTLLGLSYDNRMEWNAVYGLSEKHISTWELNKPYHVVLQVQEGVGSVYVDGTLFWRLGLERLFDAAPGAISYFYFGAYDEQVASDRIHATVANVFLYNRPLNATEITALSSSKVTIPTSPGNTVRVPAVASSTEKAPVTPIPAVETTRKLEPAESADGTSGSGSLPSRPATDTQDNKDRDVGSPGAVVEHAGDKNTVGTSHETAPRPLSEESTPAEDARTGQMPETPADASLAEDGQKTTSEGTTEAADSGTGGDGEASGSGGADVAEGTHPHAEALKNAAPGLPPNSDIRNALQERTGDGSPVCGSRVLPLFLLLGLWGFAAL